MSELVKSIKESKGRAMGMMQKAGSNEKLQAAEHSAAGLLTEDLFFCPKLRWSLRNVEFEAVKCLQQLQTCST